MSSSAVRKHSIRLLTFVTGNPKKLEEVSLVFVCTWHGPTVEFLPPLQVQAIINDSGGESIPFQVIAKDIDCRLNNRMYSS